MYKRAINEIPYTGDTIRQFGGFNNTDMIQENEFEDMMNMSSDRYPYICTRPHRKVSDKGTLLPWLYARPNETDSIPNKQESDLMWAIQDGAQDPKLKANVYYGGALAFYSSDFSFTETPVSLGAEVVFFDSGYKYNVQTHTKENLIVQFPFQYATFEPYDIAKEKLLINIVDSATAPVNPAPWKLWCNGQKLQRYDGNTGEWEDAPALTKFTVTTNNASAPEWCPSKGRTISLSGMEGDPVQTEISPTSLIGAWEIDDATEWEEIEPQGWRCVIWLKGVRLGKSVTFPPLYNDEDFGDANLNMKISEAPPELKCICAHQNRIWGFREDTHEIVASKQGDPANFNSFFGISTDSYAATLGEAGQILACTSYMNTVLFFTESSIIKVSGTQPSNYAISTIRCPGLQVGSIGSIVNINEKLYYKSHENIMMYDGYTPVSISKAIDVCSLKNVMCGRHYNKLYVFDDRLNNDGAPVYVYDTKTGLWEKEDIMHTLHCATSRQGLFGLEEGKLKYMGDRQDTSATEGAFDWYVQTGDLLLYSLDRKYLQKVKIRIELAAGATAEIYASIDGSEFKQIGRMAKPGQHTYLFPVTMSQCDSLKLKISGHGDATIKGIQKIWGEGNDI